MESQDLLSELADIHLPEVVSMWPPAFGWWVLAIILIIAAVYIQRSYISLLIRRKRMHSALQELEHVYLLYQTKRRSQQSNNQAGLDFLNGINSTLRRVALLNYPLDFRISKLNGKEWLHFLDGCDCNKQSSNDPVVPSGASPNVPANALKDKQTEQQLTGFEFRAGVGQTLAEGVYQRTFDADADALYALAKGWINRRYTHKAAIVREKSKSLPVANGEPQL